MPIERFISERILTGLKISDVFMSPKVNRRIATDNLNDERFDDKMRAAINLVKKGVKASNWQIFLMEKSKRFLQKWLPYTTKVTVHGLNPTKSRAAGCRE